MHSPFPIATNRPTGRPTDCLQLVCCCVLFYNSVAFFFLPPCFRILLSIVLLFDSVLLEREHTLSFPYFNKRFTVSDVLRVANVVVNVVVGCCLADSLTESPISNKLRLFIIVGAMRFTCHFKLNKFCTRKAPEESCRAITHTHTYLIYISYKHTLSAVAGRQFTAVETCFQMQFAIRTLTI